MSDFPINADHFVGGRRVTPVDTSEGGAPLASLLNAAGQSAESETAMSGPVDLSAATADVVKAASRGLTTNSGASRAYTLPDFASAPDGWEHTFIQLTLHTLTVTHAGTDTINGVVGDLALDAAHEWCKVMKVPGASGWYAVSSSAPIVPA